MEYVETLAILETPRTVAVATAVGVIFVLFTLTCKLQTAPDKTFL